MFLGPRLPRPADRSRLRDRRRKHHFTFATGPSPRGGGCCLERKCNRFCPRDAKRKHTRTSGSPGPLPTTVSHLVRQFGSGESRSAPVIVTKAPVSADLLRPSPRVQGPAHGRVHVPPGSPSFPSEPADDAGSGTASGRRTLPPPFAEHVKDSCKPEQERDNRMCAQTVRGMRSQTSRFSTRIARIPLSFSEHSQTGANSELTQCAIPSLRKRPPEARERIAGPVPEHPGRSSTEFKRCPGSGKMEAVIG